MHLSAIVTAATILAVARGQAAPSASCTTTISTATRCTHPSVTTIFLATHTATSEVDCGGCQLTIKSYGNDICPIPVTTATVLDDDIYGTTITTTRCYPSPTPE